MSVGQVPYLLDDCNVMKDAGPPNFPPDGSARRSPACPGSDVEEEPADEELFNHGIASED